MKHEVFNKELSYIKDDNIRNSCKTILDLLPDYFYHIPASSTGKYHPDFSLGEGGLVRHVKVATKILKDLLDNPSYKNNYTEKEKDLMFMAIIIHDGLKDGRDNFPYNYDEENNILLKKNELANERNTLIEQNKDTTDINLKIKELNKKLHFTSFNHPILIKNLVKENKDELFLNDDELNLLCSCLESHMGGYPYNTQYKYNSDEILYELPIPKTKYQVLVHTVDYLSSRKYLNVNFENNEIQE